MPDEALASEASIVSTWHIVRPPDVTPVALSRLDNADARIVAIELCRGRRWTPDERDEIVRFVVASTDTAPPDPAMRREPMACGHPPSESGAYAVPPIGTASTTIVCSPACAAEYLAAFAESQHRERNHEIARRIDEALDEERSRVRADLLARSDAARLEADRHGHAADLLKRTAHDVVNVRS